MPTIKDVAELAGVSFKTVSRVIKRSPQLRDEMRRKVLRAIPSRRGVPEAASGNDQE
jgi:DNA-binding LacI/PurR family transcriptional regulator